MTRPGLGRLATCVAVTASLPAVSACSDDAASSPPSSTLPPAIAICADAAPGTAAERCLDAIEAALAADTVAWADGAPVTHDAFSRAYNPIAASLSSIPVATAFSYDSPMADGDGELTTPISTTWTIADALRTLWTCFDGLTATVSTAECE